MVDIYLQLMMHGELNKREGKASSKPAIKKSKFEISQEKLIDDYIDTFSLVECAPKNALIPDSIRRVKIKEDLKNSVNFLNIDMDLNESFEILTNDGLLYLEKEESQEMITQILGIPLYIDQVDFNKPLKESLSTFLHISDSVMLSIFKIGIAKYNEMAYEASFSIFFLLSSLDHANEEGWYRLGIVAVHLEKINLALQAFAYAIYLNADLLGARLFSAQCYIKLGEVESAKAEITEVKNIIGRSSPEPIWIELLTNIEEQLIK
ncbi:MAG: hypothetical protein H0T62_02025 [Parachlamydiaceae bacterium]|nr:hypothetical protein [Parachlamydiaceae bacterium]